MIIAVKTSKGDFAARLEFGSEVYQDTSSALLKAEPSYVKIAISFGRKI